MACIMGCPAAHNNAALRELPEQEDMEIVGRKTSLFFHTAVRLVFLCDTPDGFCLFSDGKAARKGLLFLNGISGGFLHFPDAFLHQSGVYLMDVFSPAYSGKHQYRQVAAEVFAEGLQTFQHFARLPFSVLRESRGWNTGSPRVFSTEMILSASAADSHPFRTE